MICECNNCGGGTHITPAIRHVFGNVLRIAIPLTLRTLVKDGDTIVPTDTDFIPSSDYPVNVIFGKGNKNIAIQAEMDGNVAIIEERGKMPVGTYDITVECRDELGQPYRFKKDTVLQVVDVTAEAGIEPTIEYEAETWYLDAAIFLATTEISSMSEEIERKLEDVFGEVEYDAENKEIKFYDKNKTHVLGTLDSTPFVVDGTVDDVYIDVGRQVLVVVLNEDAGGRRFSVPLYLVFENYYKKSEVDERVNNKADVLGDGRLPGAEATPVVIDYFYAPSGVGPVIPINPQAGEVIYFASQKKIRRYYYEDAGPSGGLPAVVYVEETPSRYVVYYNKGDEKFYRYDGGSLSMVEIETGSGGGGEGTVTGVKVGSTTYEPTDGVVDISASIPDVSGFATASDVATAVAGLVDSAPSTLDTLNELAAALGDDPNFATTISTALGNKVDKETGKSLMTDAERTKLSGIAAGAEANVQADWNQTTTTADDYIKNKPDVPTSISVNQQSYPLNNNHAFVIPDYYTKTQIDNAGYVTSQRTLINMDDSDGLSFTDANGDAMTHAQVVALLEDDSVDLVINYEYNYSETFYPLTLCERDVDCYILQGFHVSAEKSSIYVALYAEDGTLYIDEIIAEGLPNIDGSLDSASYNPVQNKVITAALAGKQDKLTFDNAPTSNSNNVVKSGGVYTALAAKANTADLATVATSGSYNDLSNKPTIPAAQVNADWNASSGVMEILNKPTIPDVSSLATKSEVTAGLATKQDTLTFDNTPTSGSNNPVKSGGIYTALQTLLSNITVGQNGNWYVGETDTGVKAQGPKGNSVADGDSFDIINNLVDGGEADALSAEMGKTLNERINGIVGGGSYEEATVDVTMTIGKYIAANQGVGQVCPMTLSDAYLGGTDSAIVNMVAGQKLEIKGVGGNASRMWAILDKDTHVIQSVADANSSTPAAPFEKTIVAETDCIVVVNVYNASADPAYSNTAHTPYSVKLTTRTYVVTGGVLGEMQDDIDTNTANISANTNDINALELYVKGGDVTMTEGDYIATNQGVGQVCPMTRTQTGINDCAIINMVAGQRLEIKGVGGNASRMWAVLDKDTHTILSVADGNSSTPATPFEKVIEATTDCIVVVNVYNSSANPAYSNTTNTPYSVKYLPMAQGDVANEDVFEMTESLPSTAANFDSLWGKFVTDGLAVRSTLATVNSKPVYMYHIAPYDKIATNPNNTAAFTIADNDYFSKKKILVLAGLHGNEKQTPLWVYEFFNRILYNDDYAAYRSAFDWYVVPLVNPTGYDANTRNNYNDVNINRDFARKTQAETQALCSLIDNGDFDFLIDAHQLSGGSGNSSTSPQVCGAFIPCVNMTDATLTDLCTRYTKGGAAADAALCKYFSKAFMQTNYVWPPYAITGDDLQSHEYAFQHGVINSFSIEFTQYAYVYSGSNTIYNDGSMVYGNTVFHHLMMALLN